MDMYQKRKERQNNSKEIDKKTNINWYPGHMAKTKRLINEKKPLIDIVYELVDARIPFSSKMQNITEMIKNKPHILIMTKSDLCDINETNKWIKYYQEKKYQVITLDLTNNKDYLKLVNMTNKIMFELNNKRKEKGLNEKDAKVLIIGTPNVGKSTLINQMALKKVAEVGNKPGVTKTINWLKTKFNILLLDTPGILWPKLSNEEEALNLACMGSIKSDILPTDKIAWHIITKLYNCYPKILLEMYGIDDINDIEDVYQVIAKKLNIVNKNNEIDYNKINEKIINDLRNNKITKITFDRK